MKRQKKTTKCFIDTDSLLFSIVLFLATVTAKWLDNSRSSFHR